MAAHPYDPHKVVTGVGGDDLDVERAIAACESAVRDFPNALRFQFQHCKGA
jgi:hypothetical protein